MAREKQREREERMSNPYEAMAKQNQRNHENKLLEGKKNELFQAVEDLARKVVESEEKYGKEHFNTRVLSMFYTVTFSLQNVVEMMFAMKEAMQVLSLTMGVMDDTFKFINDMMSLENYKQYSAFGRLKMRRKINKFVKLNGNRMKAIMGMIKGYGKIANAMMKAMGAFDKKLAKTMAKQNGSKNDVVAGYNDEAQKKLDFYRSELKARKTAEDITSDSSSGAPSASSDDINIDDIV